MKATLVAWLFDIAARLPLRTLHLLGAGLGWLMYLLDGKYAARLRENLAYVWQGRPEAEFRKVLNENKREMGKSLCELPYIWRRPLEDILGKVQACHGLEHLAAARSRGQGIVVLTPHLGCFEMVGLYVAARMPLTNMYRPPKVAWLDEVMRRGRMRGQASLARTDISGVRAMFKALKRREAIGLLPDQVPGNGEGEWAPFFGRPAYTMTLAGRLAESSGASVLLSYCERLPRGAGYVMHIAPLEFAQNAPVTQQLNAALENIIRACPAQYLWSYNRYKTPAGVEPPEKEQAQ